MPTRKSIIIGCGTTGCEIAVEIFKNYQSYCAETGEPPDRIQFLLMDTQDPVPEAEDLYYRGDYLMLGIPNPYQVFDAQIRHDPFFKVWWPEGYHHYNGFFPVGRSTPVDGRFAFWTRLGNPALPDSFRQKFLERARILNEVEAFDVYIISTLCGGTGAGIFLDVAQIIKDIDEINPRIFGVFMLHDIINLRATPEVHEQTTANAYASLIALNYWQTPKDLRKIDLGNFMQTPHMVLEGDHPPFDLCYLLSRDNSNGHHLGSIEDFRHMAAEAISMMLLEEYPGQVDAHLANLLVNIYPPIQLDEDCVPRQFGSIGVRVLNYHPEKAVEYLTCELAIKTMDVLRSAPPGDREWLEARASDFFSLIDQSDVIAKIKSLDNPDMFLYPVMQTIIQQLGSSDVNNALISEIRRESVVRENINHIIRHFINNVESGLFGNLNNLSGVNYQQLMKSNRMHLFDRVVREQIDLEPNITHQPLGLHQLVAVLLQNEATTLLGVLHVLNHILGEIRERIKNLYFDLEGEDNRGIPGDWRKFGWLDDSMKQALSELDKKLFNIWRRKRIRVAQKFEDEWWKPWLTIKIEILAKEEAIAFYKALKRETECLLEFFGKEMMETLERVGRDREYDKHALYHVGWNTYTYCFEEESILDGRVLLTTYDHALNLSITEVTPELQKLIAQEVGEYIKIENRAAKSGRDFAQVLRQSINDMITQEGRRLFWNELSGLSLWDSLILGLENPSPNQIRAIIESRLRSVRELSGPNWQIDPEFMVLDGRIYASEIFIFDPLAKIEFGNQHGVEIEIQEGPLLGQGQPAFHVSPHELKILIIQAGIPLEYISPVGSAEDAFRRRLAVSSKPCIVDHRYERLIAMGLPTWALGFRRHLV
jgi:hypothetical protein